MLRDLGESLAPPTSGAGDAPPADLRRRVLTAARNQRRPRWTVKTRLAWQLGAVGAGAVAFALLVAPLPHRSGERPPPAPDAAHVLQLAARTSAALPAPARDDRFVFMETIRYQRFFLAPRPDQTTPSRLEGPQRQYTWWPVDGGLDGYYKLLPPYFGKAAGRPNDRPVEVRPTEGPFGWLGAELSLPTDPDAMLAYLYRDDPEDTRDPRATPDQRAFDRLTMTVIPMSHADPAAQAAALQAAQRIGGVETRAGVTDAAGRTGIAVGRTEYGLRTELVFDPETYRYLGYNRVATTSGGDAGPAVRAGDVQDSMAILRTAYVDKARQLP